MNVAATTVARRRRVPTLSRADVRDRSERRRVGVAWGLLVVNSMTYYGSVIHIPSSLGKAIQQGALPAAILVALSVNRRANVRPNVFLCLVTLLLIEAIFTTLNPEYFGTVYRFVRLAEYIVVLWLLTPWWGRRDLLLLRAHLVALAVALGTVILGLITVPGHAFIEGRLSGAFWVIPATEVGHYAAITAGLTIVLWFGRLVSGKSTGLIVLADLIIMVLSHTRTALIGMVAALLLAGMSVIATNSRARRFFAAAGLVVSAAVIMAAGVLITWLTRGQNAAGLATLTGRTDYWHLVLVVPRTRFQELFGFGLTNGSIDGLPVDSNWLTAYLEQGLLGVAICAAMAIFLLVSAFFQSPGIRRALALFLITYCLIASYTQVGFEQPTTYLLELTLAASLMVPPPAKEGGR